MFSCLVSVLVSRSQPSFSSRCRRFKIRRLEDLKNNTNLAEKVTTRSSRSAAPEEGEKKEPLVAAKTKAKKELIVVKSLYTAELDTADISSDVKLLHKYWDEKQKQDAKNAH